MSNLVLLLVFQGAMMLAATCDMFTMTIPNRLTAIFGALFIVAAFVAGMPLMTIGIHFAVGFAALIAGFALFSLGWIGGGDAKFFAATAMWIGPAALLDYTLMSAIFGGGLTLAIVMMRAWPLPAGLASQAWLARLHDVKTGIPYGIALAFGGLAVAGSTPWAVLAFAG